MTIPTSPLPLSYHQELTLLALGRWPHAPSAELVARRLVYRGRLTQLGRKALASMEVLVNEREER